MSKYPLLPVALALIVGILLAHHIALLTTQFWLWALVVCALVNGGLLVIRPSKAPIHKRIIIPTILFCCLLGGLLDTLTDPRHDTRHWTRSCPEKAYLAVRLTTTPEPRAKSYRTTAEVLSVDGTSCRGEIRLYLRHDSTAATLHYGDHLLLHGYPDLEHGSIYVTSDHYLVTSHDSSSLRARSERLRMYLLHRMQEGPLDRHHTGVAEALTLGWRAHIDPRLQASYRDAGIAHLLAVSGLHVGLVAAIVGLGLFWLPKVRRGRIARGSVQLVAVWFFTLMTGAAPSTVRAALMFSLFIVSDSAGRRTPKANILATAAIITLLSKPSLLFDVGWQLSYCAVAGIIVAMPLITAFRNRLWHAASVSLAATTATLPVTIATFHTFHPWFLIANMLVIPLAAAILTFALAYMALPCDVTAWPLATTLDVVEYITNFVSSLPTASIDIR